MFFVFLPVLTTCDDSVYASHEETLTDEARIVKITGKLSNQMLRTVKKL